MKKALIKKYPGVAELVYASDLKSDARERLGVRIPSPGPKNISGNIGVMTYEIMILHLSSHIFKLLNGGIIICMLLFKEMLV